jgi:hypothetical protein
MMLREIGNVMSGMRVPADGGKRIAVKVADTQAPSSVSR